MAFYSSAYNYALDNLPLVDEFLKPAEMLLSENEYMLVFLLLWFIFIKTKNSQQLKKKFTFAEFYSFQEDWQHGWTFVQYL